MLAMSARSSERSALIDVTYTQLHSLLSGHVEGTSRTQVLGFISLRIPQLKAIHDPFGHPSDASRKKVGSGSVTLSDGVAVRVEDTDKEFVFAISDAFQIDEISSLILLRSFLYNEGLPSDPTDNGSLVQELVEAITPFYFQERLSLLRVLLPLFRAKESSSEPFHEVALSVLPEVLPDGDKFTDALLVEYERKTSEKLPENVRRDPRKASRWAKQNSKEQLVILEVLFWTLWGSVSCSGPMVEKVMSTAYRLDLGTEQQNSTLLLDDEGMQLQKDKAAIWIILTIEILELETIANSSLFEISDNPQRPDFYTSSPESLKRLHQLITAGGAGQFACTYMAWTFVLSRLCAKAMESKEIPDSYRGFFELVLPQLTRAFSKDRESVHVAMARTSLDPNAGLLELMETLLVNSPLFVSAIAWKTGSTITDPNAIAFRSVFKGLLMSLVELVPVEAIPNFDLFVRVWVALFGRSETQSVAGICSQYWQADWQAGLARRAVFDIARTRFPIQPGVLVRLLRSMTASGFLDTDPLSTADHHSDRGCLTDEREVCTRHVFYFLDRIPSYSQVIPTSSCTGPQALYERQIESSSSSVTYSNVRPINLPGGSVLPPSSKGRLLNADGSDLLVVVWQHEHSGWKLLLEILMEYGLELRTGSGRGLKVSSFGRVGNSLGLTLALKDIGFEVLDQTDESLITDILDLIRSVIQDNPVQGEQLMRSLEIESDSASSSAPGLIQLTTIILEEALTRYNPHPKMLPPTRLITSAISVLSAILAIPRYSIRVWIYIRSTTALFGSEKNPGSTSAALAAERVTGQYTMTLALLKFVEQLCDEAPLLLVADDAQVRKLKDDVLMRAARFVHTEVWLEHLGWKYAQLGDRFEVGRRISAFYLRVLHYTPPIVSDSPFPKLSQAILDLLLFKASILAISPLMSAISAGTQMLRALYSSRRFGDVRRLIFLLETDLELIRLVIQRKCASEIAQQLCLLEQVLCAQITGGGASHDPYHSKVSPIDALAFYVRERDAGQVIPLEAIRVLSVVCSSLSMARPVSFTLVGHFSDPEGIVASFVRIIQHPYDDLSLRYAVWKFITVAMDKEPALASLFVSGKFRVMASLVEGKDGKGKDEDNVRGELAAVSPRVANAVDVARDALANWEQLWESDPQLLAFALRFLTVFWRHGLEHKSVLENFHRDAEIWRHLSSLACSELGPIPDFMTEDYVVVDGKQRSNVHDIVADHCYRSDAKACALHIIGLDIGIHHQIQKSASDKPLSFLNMESRFRSSEELTSLVAEATPSSYLPAIYDTLSETMQTSFPTLSIAQLEVQIPIEEREFGDNFSFSAAILRSRLRGHQSDLREIIGSAERQLSSMNLNLSLTQVQIALVNAWRFLFSQINPHLRVDNVQRHILSSLAASISAVIMKEDRTGEMTASIHGTRIAFLVSVLELAWFNTSDQTSVVQQFTELVENLRGIISNEYQPPLKSIQGLFNVSFHRPLLQLLYFCVKSARSLTKRPKALNADQRLKISSLVEAALGFVIDGLRVAFMAARTKLDSDLDKDMELLVAVFEQCTRLDINPSSTVWLARCHETDLVKLSVELFTHIDLVGISNLPALLSNKRPFYASHLLTFHMALASIPSAAERFATEGVISAYCNSSISKAASAGLIDDVLPEFPGQRSPAHFAYCLMLSIVSAIITAMGHSNGYFDAEACGLVQLYGDQIARALSWTIGDSITLPLLEEIDQVVNIFSALARNSSSTINTKSVAENVLRVFSPLALRLLQQLNYAITHPHHLASLFEPVTSDERILAENDSASSDVWKRPLIVHLTHRFVQLSSNIIFTLTCISKADIVLSGEPIDWPVHEALVVPHSKVVLGEPASIGTFLELANGTLDVLRNLSSMPPGQSLVPADIASMTKLGELNVRHGVQIARRNLEEILVYVITQLAMWLLKPEFEAPPGEADIEEQNMDVQKTEARERRGRRLSLGARFRRGMTGEMAAEVQALLTKARPVIAKTDTILGKGQTDISGALSTFIQNHVISPSGSKW